MPSGSKKRKANKKKKTNPNPNSQTPPLVPLHHQGNGHATDEDGEEEEVFETPRSQPPDPFDVAHLGNGSSPRVPLDEVPEEKRDEEEEEEEGEDVVAAVGSVDDEENPVRTEGIVADSARLYKARAENPEVSVETVDGSASHDEEEVKETNSARLTVPIENSTINVDHKVKEMPQIDDGSNKTNSDRFTEEESLVGSTVVINEILVDGADDSTSHVGEGKEVPHVDEGLKDEQLDKLAGEKYTLTENPTLVTEEVSQHSEATAENLNKILVGTVDTTPTPQEASDPSANAARTEIAPVARGPLVVRRATLWNCCGLLDVFTGSQR